MPNYRVVETFYFVDRATDLMQQRGEDFSHYGIAQYMNIQISKWNEDNDYIRLKSLYVCDTEGNDRSWTAPSLNVLKS